MSAKKLFASCYAKNTINSYFFMGKGTCWDSGGGKTSGERIFTGGGEYQNSLAYFFGEGGGSFW